MKYILFLILLLCVAIPPADAYEVIPHVTEKPYEVVSVPGNVLEQKFVIGELADYPQMIEVTSEEEFTLTVGIRALPGETAPDFAGIIVRVLEPRGVEEVARLKAESSDWTQMIDPVSRLAYHEGMVYESVVPAGTYRIEVSTASNIGKYILTVGGQQTNSGYGTTWNAVSTLYEFYGVSKIGMIRTPLVYYPLGVVLLLAGFGFTIWRTRNRLPFLQKHA